MTHQTDETESRIYSVIEVAVHPDAAFWEITTLRAQLAEALETWPIWAVQIKDKLQSYGVDPGDEWNVAEQFEAWLDEAVSYETARADRAEQRVATLEAALAAQIEADARIAEDAWLDGVPVAEISAAILAHSHDRTALDRMLAEHEVRLREAREQALRDAAEMVRGTAYTSSNVGRRLEPVSPAMAGMDMHHATIADAILAVIEKDKEN